jgi:Zn-dependent protease with chaperone function
MSDFSATYYDGRTSQQHAVTVRLDDAQRLIIEGLLTPTSYSLDEIRIAPRLGDTVRSIHLPGGAKCESPDNAAIDALAQKKGKRRGAGLVHRLESQWPWALLSLAVVLVVVVVGFKWGIPLVARQVAMNVPNEMAYDLGAGTLATLDRTMFTASQLPEQRQSELRRAFRGISESYSDLPLRLEFRHASFPNAFALPDGTVVLTDRLAQDAKTDEQILSVLAHEVGHVAHRHTLRMALENSSVALLAAVTLGDATQIATVAGALPALYANAQYSRAHETEADTFALEYLEKHGIAKHHFADMLELLQRSMGGEANDGGALQYLSSHPPTQERVLRFREK